MEVFVG